MVLAAGLGTRMRPITDTIPKPLVKIAGKPMVDYVLDLLVVAGVETVSINVHHHADQMTAHLEGRKDLRVLISDERADLLNSGGGLAKGFKLLAPGPVLVMNADLFWVGETSGRPTNLQKLAEGFDPAHMDMAMLCVDMDRTTGHNGKKDFNFAEDGRLTRYQEGEPRPVVYAGAIAMDSRLLDDAPAAPLFTTANPIRRSCILHVPSSRSLLLISISEAKALRCRKSWRATWMKASCF